MRPFEYPEYPQTTDSSNGVINTINDVIGGGGICGDRILALSVSEVKSKRSKFFEDCKPFLEVFHWKNCLFQVGHAAMLTGAKLGGAYDAFLNDAIRREQDGERNIPEFNPNYEMYIEMFKQTSIQLVSIDVIRKFYEYIARVNGSVFADKLTKDIRKSLERKLMRWPRYTAAYKIFFTSCRARLISLFSASTFEALRNCFMVPREKVDSKKVLLWVRNKTIIFCTLIPLYSLGFSVGTLVHEKHGGNVLSLILELIGSQVLAMNGIE